MTDPDLRAACEREADELLNVPFEHRHERVADRLVELRSQLTYVVDAAIAERDALRAKLAALLSAAAAVYEHDDAYVDSDYKDERDEALGNAIAAAREGKK